MDNRSFRQLVSDRELSSSLLRYLKPHWPWVLLAILLLLAARAIEVVVPIYLGNVLQMALDVSGSSFSAVIQLAGFIVVLLGMAYGLDVLNVILKNWVGERVIYQLRLDMFSHLQRMESKYYDKEPVGKLITRVIHDVEGLSRLFSQGVVPMFGQIVLLIGIVFGLVYVEWRVALCVFSFTPAIWWITRQFRRTQRKGYERIRKAITSMNTFTQEHLMGASLIRGLGLIDQEGSKFDQLNSELRGANYASVANFSFFMASIDFIKSGVMVMTFAMLVYLSPIGSEFEAGIFFTYSLYVLMFFRPLRDLAERYNTLQSSFAAAERLFEVLNTPQADRGNGEELIRIEKVEFDNVWFAYKDEEWVLRGVSFTIEQGESVALVGMSGEGKTTITRLLMGFYTQQKGRVLINGEPLEAYSLKSVRRQVALVLQNPVIFAATLEENIQFFEPSIDPAPAIEYVQLQSLVSRLPNGVATQLKERGAGLSMGEKQLISLARAIAQPASLLVLDEATSNIDSHTEKVIQEVMERILQEKTTLVIAHRLSTVRNSSRILVVDQGVVAEEGTHEQLIELGGLYDKLYKLQFVNGEGG